MNIAYKAVCPKRSYICQQTWQMNVPVFLGECVDFSNMIISAKKILTFQLTEYWKFAFLQKVPQRLILFH